MPQEMPLDIQWLTYALVRNNAIGSEDAQQMFESLPEPDLAAFAQLVLDRLAEGMDEAEAEALVEQIQELMAYAVEQAQTGETPPWYENGGDDTAGEQYQSEQYPTEYADGGNTPSGQKSHHDGYSIRRTALMYNVPIVTTLAAARASIEAIRAKRNYDWEVCCIQTHYKLDK